MIYRFYGCLAKKEHIKMFISDAEKRALDLERESSWFRHNPAGPSWASHFTFLDPFPPLGKGNSWGEGG